MYTELDEVRASWRYQPDEDCLAGRTIAITGAGAGIGAAAAKTFAVYGANIVLIGRSRQPLEDVFDWIAANTPTEPVIVPADLEHLTEDAAANLRDSIQDTYGGLHGLVHNASRLGAKTPLAQYPVEEWQRVLQTNVTAPFILTKALLPLLTASESCVINTSSTVGREGRAYWGAYSVSKFALEGFSQILADETEHTGLLRVYSVNPGGTRTAMRAEAYPAEDPLSVPTPETHMDLYLYLMEGESQGKTLPVTGAQLDARTWELNRG